ncbi:hypothetical protein BH09ACT7_BH09ACT7_18290 [soil metagenome]
MTETLDKFNDWLQAVMADPLFTGTDKCVMSYIAVFYVRHGEDTFCVRQSTIAARCGTTAKTVTGTIGRAKDAGYLEVVRYRERGTGRNKANELRLTLPELSNGSSHHSRSSDVTDCDATPQSDVTDAPELDNQNTQSEVTDSPELGNRANPLTSDNDTPTGLDTGFITVLSSRVLRAHEQDPPDSELIEAEIVDEHAALGGAVSGLFADLFSGAANAMPEAAAPKTVVAKTLRCPWCHGTGIVLNSEGKPGEHIRACHHDGERHPTTPEEAAQLLAQAAALGFCIDCWGKGWVDIAENKIGRCGCGIRRAR